MWNQRLDWSKNGNSFTYPVILPKMVNCSYIESIADSDEPGYSKALVLHFMVFACALEHPDFDPSILLKLVFPSITCLLFPLLEDTN